MFLDINICVDILCWLLLCVGTKDGAVLCFSPDKPHFSSPWNASSERDEDDGDDGDLEEEAVSILRLHWMAPQPPSLEGCLFALLGKYAP